MAFKLKSPDFNEGQIIPTEYSGEGQDVSPPLEWSGVPSQTRELVLICEDPDAPSTQPEPFVHWVAYGISPTISKLPRGLPGTGRIQAPVSIDQGENSFGNTGYNGPLPPMGDGPHRYVFRLFALSAQLGLRPGLPKPDVMRAMENLVLDEAQLMGRYERPLKAAA